MLAAAAMLALLGGCGKREKLEPLPAPPAAIPTPAATPGDTDAPQPTPGLNPTQRLARVVDLLNRNEEKTARVELDALLAQDPNRREARVLEQSIKGNPYEMVPRNSFSYVVAPGDTFITLALDYLGDSYKFYALARISGIAPNMLKAGDIIQMPGRVREPSRPGVQRARPPVTRTRPSRRSAAPTTGTAPATSAAPAAPQGDPAAALRYRRQGLEQMTAGRIDRAVSLLGRALQYDPDNRAIAADLARARRIQGAVQTR
jgi:tetratricopeptide (TPR) repeat protein